MKIIRFILKFVLIFAVSFTPTLFILLFLNLEVDDKDIIDLCYHISILIIFTPLSFYLVDKYKLIN